MEKKDNQTITLVPRASEMLLRDAIRQANSKLEALRNYVNAHGESWADVREYAAKGAGHKIERRKDECRQWLAATHAPQYMHEGTVAAAVADLGAENIKYWEGLGGYLDIIADGQPLDLLADVDATDAAWTVSEKWVQARRKAATVAVPDRVMAERGTLEQLRSSAARLIERGMAYAVESLVADLLQGFKAELDAQRLWEISCMAEAEKS